MRFALVAAVWCLATSLALAADQPRRVKYVPPAGFAGFNWGAPRKTFDRLPAQPFRVGSAWLLPVVTQHFSCPSTCGMADALLTLYETREGGGFYMMAEYAVDDQGFQFGTDDQVQFYPVVYQFCANWWKKKDMTADNFEQNSELCGMRLVFQSETAEELRKLPADYVTYYDRVLTKLLARFGKPDSFVRRGVVVIATMEGEEGGAPARKFRTYRWCPAFDRGLRTPCTASVTLTMDPVTGVGIVYYSTPLVWEYAYARQHSNRKGDPLFKVLHARK
jgi:hypothetical protein